MGLAIIPIQISKLGPEVKREAKVQMKSGEVRDMIAGSQISKVLNENYVTLSVEEVQGFDNIQILQKYVPPLILIGPHDFLPGHSINGSSFQLNPNAENSCLLLSMAKAQL